MRESTVEVAKASVASLLAQITALSEDLDLACRNFNRARLTLAYRAARQIEQQAAIATQKIQRLRGEARADRIDARTFRAKKRRNS